MLTVKPEVELNHGGIYIISYDDRLDTDFNDIDHVVYVGSTRLFKRRYGEHRRNLENRKHTNKFLKRVSKAVTRNEGQQLHFTPIHRLPRLDYSDADYDRILKGVEQFFIHLHRRQHNMEIELEYSPDDYYTFKSANSTTDAYPETQYNGERLQYLLSGYSNKLECEPTKKVVNEASLYWSRIAF